jgi:hypothetical protein
MLEEMIDGYESAIAGGDGSPRNGSAPAPVLDQAKMAAISRRSGSKT